MTNCAAMKNVVFCTVLFMLVLACRKEPSAMDNMERVRAQQIANAESDLERLCYVNNHAWMRMQPMVKGLPTAKESCMGCMADQNTHICDMDEYKKYNRGP